MHAQKKILCIEDDREVASLIAEDLETRGYSVELAHDGPAGMALLLRGRPDLTICDISMPGMSGFDLLERLVENGFHIGSMPFIFLTALSDRVSELKGRTLGADDYITKPVDFEILAKVIAARLGRVARDGNWADNAKLNDREIDVLTWSARGKTSEEIAVILNLTRRTIDFYMERAKAKLGAESRIEAVAKAISGGLIRY